MENRNNYAFRGMAEDFEEEVEYQEEEVSEVDQEEGKE